LWWAIQALQRHAEIQSEVVLLNWSSLPWTDQYGAPPAEKPQIRSKAIDWTSSRRSARDVNYSLQPLLLASYATSAICVVQGSACSHTEEFIADEICRIDDSVHESMIFSTSAKAHNII